MQIALIVFVLYALVILIWCSLKEDGYRVLISPGLLRQWSASRSDMFVFELHPEGMRQVPSLESNSAVLPMTPSGLRGLAQWIPPGSTLVLCNHGLPIRSVKRVQEVLFRENIARVYWLEEREGDFSCGAVGRGAMPRQP